MVLLAMAKQKSQVDKFRQAAKEAGADDSEDRFNETLKDLAKNRPKGECRHPRMLVRPLPHVIKSRRTVDRETNESGSTHAPTCRNATGNTQIQKLPSLLGTKRKS